jgi:hypothetical protein
VGLTVTLHVDRYRVAHFALQLGRDGHIAAVGAQHVRLRVLGSEWRFRVKRGMCFRWKVGFGTNGVHTEGMAFIQYRRIWFMS